MLTWDEAVRATGGESVAGRDDLAIAGVATDTRHLDKGALFVAIKGPNFNGHASRSRRWPRGPSASWPPWRGRGRAGP